MIQNLILGSFKKKNISSVKLYKESITKSLIICKRPRKMTNNFFNNCMFVHTFQWTSSEDF